MKKLGFTILLTLFAFSISNAQDYKTGIGLRGGFASGVTIKHFVTQKSALEAIVSTRWQGLQVTGLYEIHNRAFNVDRLNWYFGFGGHVGFWNGDNANWGDSGESYIVIGVDGILGLEYNFERVPFNLSIDWKPAFNLFGHTGFWADGGALSVRYIF
ncbi:MAG: hypothetical protein R6V32_05095 [Bacteroidales bacterium]